MIYHKQVKKDYNITEQDFKNIEELKPFMSKYKKEFAENLSNVIKTAFGYPDNINKEMIKTHKEKMEIWFDKFFEGRFDNDYISFLAKIGKTHSKHRIPPSKVAGAFSYIREWMHEKIFQNMDYDVKRKELLLSMHKFMDINQNVITSAYYEKEISKFSEVFSLRNITVGLSERFSMMMHILLATILVLLTLAATFFFAQETVNAMLHDPKHFLIPALGSLLIIWVLVELLHTEIQMIKGGKFKISVFIGVAMIAFVRDLLINTLKHEENGTIPYFFLASIVGLGVIYWLVSYTEKIDFCRSDK
jgi:uncharacterized membrane protein (DUF373 family)